MTESAYDQMILSHYEKQASEHGLKPSSTMLDATVRERETQLLRRFVRLAVEYLRKPKGHSSDVSLCDVGCGNGFTLDILCQDFPDIQYWGIEFTPALAALARQRFIASKNVTVDRGDIRSIEGVDGKFNIVLAQRVLINLLDAADQQKALSRLSRMLRPGGFFLSIEAFEEPLARLNAAREEFDLPPLPMADHNRYLTRDFYAGESSLVPLDGPTLDPDLPADFLPGNFLSSHYFVARVLHPLVVNPQKPLIRNSHFVQFLSEAWDRPVGDYSPIRAQAFRKL